MKYRKPEGKAVRHVPTKWDTFTLIKTEHPYRHQKGSGRSECFKLAKDGQTIGEWTKACAQVGFDSRFAIGGLLKLQGAKKPGWTFSAKNAEGKTLDEVQKARRVKVAQKKEAA